MADRYNHPDGLKAQDIEMAGNKLRKKGIIEERSERMGKAAETKERPTSGRRRQPGTSGYLRPKGQVYEDLDKVFE